MFIFTMNRICAFVIVTNFHNILYKCNKLTVYQKGKGGLKMKETMESLRNFVLKNTSLYNDIKNLHTIFKIATNRVDRIFFFNNGYWFVHFAVTTLEFYVSRSESDETKIQRIKVAKEICAKLFYILGESKFNEKNVIQFSEMTGAKIKEVVGLIHEIYNTCQNLREEISFTLDDGTKLNAIIGDDEFFIKIVA